MVWKLALLVLEKLALLVLELLGSDCVTVDVLPGMCLCLEANQECRGPLLALVLPLQVHRHGFLEEPLLNAYLDTLLNCTRHPILKGAIQKMFLLSDEGWSL